MPLPALVQGGIALAPLVTGMFKGGGKSGPDTRGIIDRYLGMKPTGYFTEADGAFVSSQLGRANRNIRASGRLQHEDVKRSLGQRRIEGPARESAQGRVRHGELLAMERASEGASELSHRIRSGREQFQQQGILRALGLEVAGAQDAFNTKQAQNAAFWDSMNTNIGLASDYFSKNSTALGTQSTNPPGDRQGIPTGPNDRTPGGQRPGPAYY